MTEQPSEPVNEQAEQPKSGPNKTIIYVVAGVLVLLCCCLVVAAAIIGLDPFNLNLLDRLLGGYDPIASTLPADTDFYLQVDLLKLDSEQTTAVLEAFLDAADSDIRDKEDLLDALDDEFEWETGMNFTDDVKPWLGQYIGLAFIDFEVDIYGEPTTESMIFIIETIDTAKADEYILDLIDNYEDDGWDFDDQDYNGVTIFESEDYIMAIARRDQLIYLAESADAIEDALDVVKGESLSSDPTFKSAIGDLPADRLMTFYAGADFFDAAETFMANTYYMEQPPGDTFKMYRSLSMALTVVDQGVQIDTVTGIDPAELSSEQAELMTTKGDSRELAAYFPEDTYAFVAGRHLDLVWDAYREQLIDLVGEDEFDYAMEDIEYEVGLNIDDDLFPYLDGSWALGVYETNRGMLAEDSEVPIGLMMIIGSSSIEDLKNTTEDVADARGEEQFYEVEEVSKDGLELYEIIDPYYTDTPMFVFGTGQSYLLIGSDTDALENAFGGGSSLGDSARFNEAWEPFAGNMVPVLYLDVTGLIDLYEATDPWDDPSALKPLEKVALAASPIEGEKVHSQLLFFINTD